MTSKAQIVKIKTNFKGITLPAASSGKSGQAFEKILSDCGNPVDPGQCADYPKYELEVKTKELTSRSANVVGTMCIDDIIKFSYETSPIAKKFQKQFRVKTENSVIVSQEIFNFSQEHIQLLIKEAYDIVREKIIAGDRSNYIPGTKYGYLEKRRNTESSYMFRISVGAMASLETSSKSTFGNLFSYES